MDFEEYYKKMCGDSGEFETASFKVSDPTTSFNKKELRWLKDQLETCIEWEDPKSNKRMYRSMLKKVEERLELL